MNLYSLNNMIITLSLYKRNKEELLEKYINDRLSKSLETYYCELFNSLKYLISKNELKVLKNINKVD